MELHSSRMMWMGFVVVITAGLTEVNSTARFISKNEWKTKTTKTMNAGNVNNNTMQKEKGKYIVPSSPRNVNTMQTPNSAEGAKWKLPSRRGVTKRTIFQKHLEKEKISPTDISIKDTKDEQENLNSAVTLTKNNSTGFFHHIGTIVGVVVAIVGSVIVIVFLCNKNELLCFKKKAKCVLGSSSIALLSENINTPNEPVDKDNVLKVEIEKINTPDTDTNEDEVDIHVSSASTNSPVCVYEYTSKYSNIQPTDARE